jgi:hypothetical protein
MDFHSKYLINILKRPQFPLLLLIIANLTVGLWTFRDYGLSWDEPLFYQYADSIGYAYSISARLSGNFNIEQAYGPSASDHKTRGPAYLLLARQPVYLIETVTGLDTASTWHLVNFLFYQLGIVFLFLLCRRWMRPWSAFAAGTLFSAQPVLWGHAFINPKDPSFMVLFLGTVYFGFRMVDGLVMAPEGERIARRVVRTILPGIFLGLATSIRIIAPLSGLLVFIYFLLQNKARRMVWLIPYGLIAAAVCFATWPYLWADPLSRFIQVAGLMSDNPTEMNVLFLGNLYPAYDLPRRYLPFYLLATLTEPVWPLFGIGTLVAAIKARRNQIEWKSLSLILLWFALPALYVVIRTPPMYDGFRHFLFIIPPVFVLTGLAFEFAFDRLRTNLLGFILLAILVFPGLYGIVRLHPYEYSYYNSYVRGMGGAYRQYETDYWLTCYKEAMSDIEHRATEPLTLYVQREPSLAAYYTNSQVTVKGLGTGKPAIGDWMLLSTRANLDQRSIYHNEPTLFTVGRQGAVFCEIKQIKEAK